MWPTRQCAGMFSGMAGMSAVKDDPGSLDRVKSLNPNYTICFSDKNFQFGCITGRATGAILLIANMEFNGGKRKLEDNLFMTPIHSKKRVCLSKLHKQNTTADVLPVDVMEDQEAEGEVVKPGVKDEEIPEMSMEVVVTSGVLEGNHSSGEDLEEIEGEEPCI